MVEMSVGVISRPKKGFNANGDAYLVESLDHMVLLSVIDGIGHGEHANRAAVKCVSTIKQYLHSGGIFTLSGLFDTCHEALKDTDGVVMASLLIDTRQGSVQYAGIGNVTTRIIGKENIYPLPRGGIVGYNMPQVKEHTFPYKNGDLILMHTDGIISRINSELLLSLLNLDEQKIAEELFKQYARDEDDATLLVARQR
jgi:serine phosphatase RsbU (regulator of sigma subunit)